MSGLARLLSLSPRPVETPWLDPRFRAGDGEGSACDDSR